MHLTRTQRNEEYRKFAHITIGLGVAGVSLYIDRWWLVAALVAGLILDLILRNRAHWVHNMIDVGRTTYGDYSYVLGIAVVAALFADAPVFVGAVLVLALSDGLAGLIGRLFGTHHYYLFGADKTIIGSTVFFTMTFILVFFILTNEGVATVTTLWQSAGIAAAVTVVEGSVGYGLDNFAVPLVTGGLLALVI